MIVNGLRKLRMPLGILKMSIGLSLSQGVTAEDGKSQLPSARISIIIEDMVNHLRIGEAGLALPGQKTYSFLLHSPYGWELATQAHVR